MQQPGKNSIPTLSFFLPSLDTFFCYALLAYLLSENVVSEHVIILFCVSYFLFLCHSPPYLSTLSFFSEFHLTVHIIKFSFFLFSSQRPKLAVTVSRRSRDRGDCRALFNSYTSPPVSRLRRRTLHFFRILLAVQPQQLPPRSFDLAKDVQSSSSFLFFLFSFPSTSRRILLPLPLEHPT